MTTLTRERYDQVWQEIANTLPNGNEEHVYMVTHQDRFFEMFEHMAHYISGIEPPRVLEFGTSNFTIMIKMLFPQVELVTVDRPVEMYGFPAEFSLDRCGATHHYNINHNTDPIGPDWGEPAIGRFDFVLFCEILEHLATSPVQLLEELISLLKPNGVLYLTTPNFFSMFNLQQISQRQHPGDLFRRRGEDSSAAMHTREYALPELVQFSEEAGGKVIKAIYSDSFFKEHQNPAMHKNPEYRSNLLIAVSPQNSSRPIEEIMVVEGKTHKPMPVGEDRDSLLREIERLNTLVDSYENGRVIRMIKWLREKGLPV